MHIYTRFLRFLPRHHVWFVASTTAQRIKPQQSNIQYYNEVNTLVTFLILSDFNQMYWERIVKHIHVCVCMSVEGSAREGGNKIEIGIEQKDKNENKTWKTKIPQINSHHRNHRKSFGLRSKRNAITWDSDCILFVHIFSDCRSFVIDFFLLFKNCALTFCVSENNDFCQKSWKEKAHGKISEENAKKWYPIRKIHREKTFRNFMENTYATMNAMNVVCIVYK